MRVLILVLSAFLVGCSATIESVADKAVFSSLVGRELHLKQPSILFVRKERLYQPEIGYFLYPLTQADKIQSGSITLPVGTQIIVTEVNQYTTDARGRWIGVVGSTVINNEEVEFIYQWSKYTPEELMVAPWEPIN